MKKLSNEEIAKQYQYGIVPIMPMIENLIYKFEEDKTSLDIQQLQLVTEYLIIERHFNEGYIEELEGK